MKGQEQKITHIGGSDFAKGCEVASVTAECVLTNVHDASATSILHHRDVRSWNEINENSV